MAKFLDLSGRRFGRVVVLRRDVNRGRRVTFLCKCDCGNTFTTTSTTLQSGSTKSCGCLRKELDKARSDAKTNKPKRLYTMWVNIKSRCFNKNRPDYKYYGGRGITVYEKWIKNFIVFRNWALSSGYNESLTIDRINNNGNYEPENCRFVTRKEQSRNTRRNRYYKGKPIVQLCEEYGLDYGYVRRRLNFYKDPESKFFGE